MLMRGDWSPRGLQAHGSDAGRAPRLLRASKSGSGDRAGAKLQDGGIGGTAEYHENTTQVCLRSSKGEEPFNSILLLLRTSIPQRNCRSGSRPAQESEYCNTASQV